MLRLDYIHQDLYTRKTRFQYTYQDPLVSSPSLINIDQLPLTRMDNQMLYQNSRRHRDSHSFIKILTHTERTAP